MVFESKCFFQSTEMPLNLDLPQPRVRVQPLAIAAVLDAHQRRADDDPTCLVGTLLGRAERIDVAL